MLLSTQLLCKCDGVTQQAYKILPRKNTVYQSPSLTLNRTSSADAHAYLKNSTVIMENYRELKHYRSLRFHLKMGLKQMKVNQTKKNTLQGSTVTHTGVWVRVSILRSVRENEAQVARIRVIRTDRHRRHTEGRGTTRESNSEGIAMGWQQIHRKLHKNQNNTAAEIRLEA